MTRPHVDVVEGRAGAVTARYSRPRGVAALWFGVLAPALAWAAHLQLTYLLVPHACERDSAAGMLAVHGAALAVAAAGVLVAWRAWRRVGARLGASHGGVIGRSRFMALGGMVLGLWFMLLIVGEALPSLLVPPCT